MKKNISKEQANQIVEPLFETESIEINERIDSLPNANLLSQEQKDHLFELANDKGIDFLGTVKIQDDGEFHFLIDVHDEFLELFGNATHWRLMPRQLATTFYHTSNEPKPLAGVGKIAPNTNDSHNFFDVAAKEITELLKARMLQAATEKQAKAEHKKNGTAYKNKFYKNIAKKSKVSPILSALINKTK